MNLKFKQRRRDHHLTFQMIAEAATVSPTDVYLFEIGVLLAHETKELIVQALSRLTHQPYALSDFEPAIPEQPFTPLVIGDATELMKGVKQA